MSNNYTNILVPRCTLINRSAKVLQKSNCFLDGKAVTTKGHQNIIMFATMSTGGNIDSGGIFRTVVIYEFGKSIIICLHYVKYILFSIPDSH